MERQGDRVRQVDRGYRKARAPKGKWTLQDGTKSGMWGEAGRRIGGDCGLEEIPS